MKKWLLIYFSTLTFLTVNAQWTTNGTNIYNTNTGNVGIGLSNPALTLEMNTTSQGDGIQMRYLNGTGFVRLCSSSIGQNWYNPITQNGDAGIIYGISGSVDAITTGFAIAPYRSATSGLRVDNNGNVGIYTINTHGYQLAVNGSAIFTSATVKLYNNWPDYVFNKGYRLPTLDSLSAFIQFHHHLPDIPSADSVAANGIELGSNQAALLKKIEELTLYVIAQDKEMDRLRQEQQKIEVLSQQLKTQQERMDQLEKRIGKTH